MNIPLVLDIAGVITYAQHHSDVDLLKSTFPDLTDEQAFAIVDGHATITREGARLAFHRTSVH